MISQKVMKGNVSKLHKKLGKLAMLCSIKNTREDPNTIATSDDKTIHKLALTLKLNKLTVNLT